MFKILLNPGHSLNGNPDPGAAALGRKEALVCAEICHAAKKTLDALYKTGTVETIVLQQSNPTGKALTANQQLNQLVRDINASSADLCISVHMNAANTKAYGIETIYEGNSVKGKQIAKAVQDALVAKAMGGRLFTNRGIKADVRGLAVLKRTIMPACLVEAGFIDNKADADVIADHTDQVAARLVEGIQTYLTAQGIKPAVKQKVPAVTSHIFELQPNADKYDLLVDKQVILKANKLATCLTYIQEHYC